MGFVTLIGLQIASNNLQPDLKVSYTDNVVFYRVEYENKQSRALRGFWLLSFEVQLLPL